MKRLDILDRDEERFVNEMLFAGVMPSTSSDLANLGNDLITNLAGNAISGAFTAEQLATMAKNIAKVLGIQNSTTGRLLQEAVNSKIVQNVVGNAKLPEVLDRVNQIRQRLEQDTTPESISPIVASGPSNLAKAFEAAEKREAVPNLAHTSSPTKILAPKIKNPSKSDFMPAANFSSSQSESSSPSNQGGGKTSVIDKPVAATSAPPPAKPDVKLEAAREIVDPRELLGGSYVFRNPKYTATDPLLQDKKHMALGDYGSKYFAEAQRASISAGSKIGNCDVKATRSDKLCKLEACKNSKPCKCYEGMLKTVQEFEMKRAENETEAAAGAANDVVASRIQDTGNTVEASVRQALKIKYDDLRKKLNDPTVPQNEKDKLLDGTKNVEELEKREAIERSFYIKKVLLNGVMNTKTPACVLNKGRYGIGSKRDPETEPEWIFPKENYCHQFDIEPQEPFNFDPQKPGNGLSQQDAILLRLSLRTLDGLEESSNKGLSKEDALGGLNSREIKVGEQQVCSSRSLCTLPDPMSRKPLFYRIFADESKDLKAQKLFDGETDNTIARTLLRCFGPREWGGMLIRMMEDLQPMAVDCSVPAARRMSKDINQNGLLQTVCSWKQEEGVGKTVDATELERTEARDRIGRKFRTSSGKVFPFDSKGSSSTKVYCQAIRSRYEALFDILRGATLLNPLELCSEARFKEYRQEVRDGAKHKK